MSIITEEKINDDEFYFLVDGEKKYCCAREHVLVDGSERRGFWLLKLLSLMGPLVVERNQYSNDIREMVNIHENGKSGRPVFGARFRIECPSRAYYDVNVNDWLEDIKTLFPGEWSAEYDDWRRLASFERDDV